MSLFARKKGREKSEQIWVHPNLKFIGKLSAEDQMEFLQDQAKAKLETKGVRLELEALEHSFNRQSTELEKLRAAAGDNSHIHLLESAKANIEFLRKDNHENRLRLGMFDDVMALFNVNKRTRDVNCSESIEDRISEYLNKG